MSVIADVRQALQDLVTPEFKALVVRVEAIEKKMEADKQEVLAAIRGLADYNSLALRLTRVEAKQESAHQ